MRLPVQEFDKWYNAQDFGNKTSYGFHDGVDLNLKTGGDTDLGQPIFSIANGEVTSVHNHSGKPTFGNHLHIKHVGPWGEIYSHYAHCKDILCKIGDKVTEGQTIATVGKSGTDFAHLHFSIKLQPTGVDGIAKTQDDLTKWTNPLAFIQKWSNFKEDMPTWFKTLLQERGLSIENESEIRNLFEKAKKYDDEILQLQEQLKSANENLADKSYEVSELLGKNQSLASSVTELEKLYNTAKSERDTFSWENEKIKIQVEELQRCIGDKDKQIDGLKIDLVKSREAYEELSEQTVEALKWYKLIALALRKVFKK
jgi:hypothetical protein